MGDSKRIRIVVISSCLDWSGMILSEIAREDVDMIGVLLDVAKPHAPRLKNAPSFSRKLACHARLSLRFPRMYLVKVRDRIKKALGLPVQSFYQQLNRKEEKLFDYIISRVSKDCRAIIEQCRRFPMLDQACRAFDIPMHKVDNVNSSQSIELLQKLGPDLIVGLGTRILAPSVLSIPPLGALNGHSSLLPNYRGGTTEFWQLLHGESETGVTIHFMTERVDEGNIVQQAAWPVYPGADH